MDGGLSSAQSRVRVKVFVYDQDTLIEQSVSLIEQSPDYTTQMKSKL